VNNLPKEDIAVFETLWIAYAAVADLPGASGSMAASAVIHAAKAHHHRNTN